MEEKKHNACAGTLFFFSFSFFKDNLTSTFVAWEGVN